MIIDFHTHAFSTEICKKAMTNLSAIIGYNGYTEGTIESNLEHFKEWGVDKAVTLSIATKPSQQKIINDWAKSQQSEKIIPFGSVHPFAEDAIEELDRIKTLGLKGVKLHPDYQGFYFDDKRVYPVYKKLIELKLPVIVHAGLDVKSPDDIHCTPEMVRSVLDDFPEITLVLAHLGGNDLWDEVYEKLAGYEGNLYFDTAFTANICPDDMILKIIKKHGADRILFASDCPWHKSSFEIDMINRLDLSQKEKDMIFYENAVKLLSL